MRALYSNFSASKTTLAPMVRKNAWCLKFLKTRINLSSKWLHYQECQPYLVFTDGSYDFRLKVRQSLKISTLE